MIGARFSAMSSSICLSPPPTSSILPDGDAGGFSLATSGIARWPERAGEAAGMSDAELIVGQIAVDDGDALDQLR